MRQAAFVLLVIAVLLLAWVFLSPTSVAPADEATDEVATEPGDVDLVAPAGLIAWQPMDGRPPRRSESAATSLGHAPVASVGPTAGPEDEVVVLSAHQRPCTGADDGAFERRLVVQRPALKYPRVAVDEVVDAEGRLVTRQEYVADHLLVRLQPGVEQAAMQQRLVGTTASIRRWWPRQGLALIATAAVGPTALADLQQQILRHRDLIRGAERDHIDQLCATPDDPRYGDMWALHNTGQDGGTSDVDIDAPEAWDLSTGSHEVLVGVLDTGVDYLHPDLQDTIWVNPGEIPDNGLDDDGNGFVDDIHGWDFVNEDNAPLDDRVGGNGPKGHGTHIAGTIAARGDNGVGVTGICWNARIVAAKVLTAGGQLIRSDAVRAIHYFHDVRAAGNALHVVNHSWGGSGSDTAALEEALSAGQALDVIHCAAAGNNGRNIDDSSFYPASLGLANMITVAAIDRKGALATFSVGGGSNYGVETVDIAAPGKDVLNTTRTVHNGGYDTMSGTSMACPHVAGVTALVWSLLPQGAGYATVRSAVVDSAVPLASLDGKVKTGGMVNARLALEQLRGAATGPYVTALLPDRPVQVGAIEELTLRFSADMDADSFTIANDVVSFTGPGGVDLAAALTGHRWDDDRTLVLECAPQRAVGTYSLAVGPDLTASGTPMDQDRDGTPGETTADRFTGAFSIAAGAGPRVIGLRPMVDGSDRLTGLQLFFSEAIDAAAFSLDRIESFVGPSGQDLRGQLESPAWSVAGRQLDLTLSAAQAQEGRYRMSLSAQTKAAADETRLDQDGDGIDGEASDDRYEGSVVVVAGVQPDGFGYVAQGATASGSRMVSGDPGVQVFNQFDAYEYDGTWTHPTSGIDLGEHRFNFYGEIYDEVYISSYWLITFGGGFSFHEHSTMSSDPLQAWPREAGIAVLWEAWDNAGYSYQWPSQRLEEILYRYDDRDGDAQIDTMLLQFEFISSGGEEAIAQVELAINTGAEPGIIRVHYLDLDISDVSLGSRAVVGIKDAGGQGPDRLLVADQDAQDHPWVSTGQAIVYSVPISIGGRVFDDGDGDGQPDAGEAGVVDQIVYVDADDDGQLDAGETQATSDADGNWSLLLPPEPITLRVHHPPELTTPASWSLDLAPGAQRSDLHVGLGAAVANDPPTITAGPSADPTPVTGTSTELSVSASDDGGAANLSYTWSAAGPASVSFSANGNNAAALTTATFQQAGSYTFTVVVEDAQGATDDGTVDVTVEQRAFSVEVTP